MTEYKNTVFLPNTDFPMRANLPQKEPEHLARWEKMDIYKQMLKSREGCQQFVLHDGPPYANGHIHIGTALNKILKDVVNRNQYLLGKLVYFTPGWDCHGLPIEWKIEEQYREAGKDKDNVPVVQFLDECRAFAQKWIDIQREEFKRLGVFADWDNPYLTMSKLAESSIAKEIGKFLMRGDLYRGEKPVLWSFVEKTALAEAEVEYKDRTSPAIYVGFPLKSSKLDLGEGVKFIIWTTTPWTIPGNRGIAYGNELDYVLAEAEGKKFVVAEELLSSFETDAGILSPKVLKKFKGAELEGSICAHPFAGLGYDFDVPLIHGEHVTTDAGTGLVHIGPSHGMEDFLVAKAFGLEIPHTVDNDGSFYKHVPMFAGLHIFKANPVIIEKLQELGHLIHAGEIVHSCAHSWRSKAPLIYRTTPQWFISMDKLNLREKALREISNVKWVPERGQRRIESMIAERPDWCISRQRRWGVPLPIFIDKQTGEPLRDQGVIDRIVQAFSEDGISAWETRDPQSFLGADYKLDDYEQCKDVVDVWFDSGCTHAFVLEEQAELYSPADLYLEGSDQHRGWFHTTLLESCGTRGVAPYKTVLTHGYVLDEHGRKMSKSLGNTISPNEVATEMGIEILRLWVVASDFQADLRIGKDILKYQQDTYRRLRNTLRYLLGGLSGYSDSESVSYEQMPELEKWVLARVHEMDAQMRQAIETYDFQEWYSNLHNFCSGDLSAFYFDIRKDVLYCDAEDNLTRRAMRTVFDHLFQCLATWLAPVLNFTAEEAWMSRYGQDKSVHLSKFPDIPSQWKNDAVVEKYQQLRKQRKVMTGALEVARASGQLGSSLQAHLKIYDPEAVLFNDVDWAEISIASTIEVIKAPVPEGAYLNDECQGVGVVVEVSSGQKCERCWKVLPEVGAHSIYDDLCNRCADVLEERAV